MPAATARCGAAARVEGRGDALAGLLARSVSARAAPRLRLDPGSQGLTGPTLQRLGTPLDKQPPKTEPKPKYGHASNQRRFSLTQYISMWEQEQGRILSETEWWTIQQGCIGIVSNNLSGGLNPPLREVYATFGQAHDAMTAKNAVLEFMAQKEGGKPPSERYGLFGILFWSNQAEKESERRKSVPGAFRPDAGTGRIDMSGYKHRPQPGHTNFDYGFWDEASQSFWHANHMDYGDPKRPMKVLQSTREKFAHEFVEDGLVRYAYPDFDRAGYSVALVKNYDVARAAAAAAKR